MATIPIWDPTNNKKIFVEHPTMLPHEVIHYLVATGCVTVQEVADLSGRHDQNLGSKKNAFCDKHLLDDNVCIALGFHGDGVPFQKSTHKQANTEVLSWNFLCDKDGKRYMFCNINKDFVCCCGCHGRCTLDALLEVFVWSMDIMLEDHVPLDEERNALRSNPLGFSGVLLQLLSFTNWNSNSICWRCKATKESYKDCGPTAPWRHNRYKMGEFLALQIQNNQKVSPLFQCPGFTLEDVCTGSLHCMDLGVAQDILGNIMWEAVQWLDLGPTNKIRCYAAWQMLKKFYKDNKTARCRACTSP